MQTGSGDLETGLLKESIPTKIKKNSYFFERTQPEDRDENNSCLLRNNKCPVATGVLTIAALAISFYAYYSPR